IVGIAPDGSRAAFTVTPDAAAAPVWEWLANLAGRLGVNLRPRPTLWVVDTATGRVEAELDGVPDVTGWVPTAVFSDDGRQLAFVTGGELRVYDLPPRLPWGIVLAGTAVAALGFAALDFGVRRLGRRS